MFYKMQPETKKYIVSQGEIEFTPTVKWKNAGILDLCIKHEVSFDHHDGKKDELGSFYLTVRSESSYEMAKLEFSNSCSKGLKLFMFELILKHAIKEAKLANVGDLIIECDDLLMVEAFLTCHFRVECIKQKTKPNSIYRGRKEIAQDKARTIGFTAGLVSL